MKRFQPYATGGIIVLGLLAMALIVPLIVPANTGRTVRFIGIFLSILLTFIFFILWLGRTLHRKVSKRLFTIVEMVLIVLILGGVVAMFQPWTVYGLRWGFIVLLYSVFAYTVWSHLVPRGEHDEEDDLGTVSLSESA